MSCAPLWFQEIHVQLYTQKAALQRIVDVLRVRYSDTDAPVPAEIHGQLPGITESVKQVEVKVEKTHGRVKKA